MLPALRLVCGHSYPEWQRLVVSENGKDSTRPKTFAVWFFKEMAC